MPPSRDFEVNLSDGASISCRVMGEGIPVLWVSGLSGVASFWERICPGLEGIKSITFDQRGLCASKRGDAPVSVDRLAADAMAILDQLGLAQAHVVGHSTGGCIAMTMALAAPQRINSLIVSGSWAGPHPYLEALFGWRLKLLETDPTLYETIGSFISSTPRWLVDQPHGLRAPTAPWTAGRVAVAKERIAALLAFDRRQEIERLSLPCLVLGARDDMIIPLFLQEELARLMPTATLKVLDQGAHFFPHCQHEAFVNHARDWFRANHAG